jgi:hypothetical protein
MLFIKGAKILSTLLYEFFQCGNIDTITTSPDKLVRRTNQAAFSDLRKSGIHKTFGEFVVHMPIISPSSYSLGEGNEDNQDKQHADCKWSFGHGFQ